MVTFLACVKVPGSNSTEPRRTVEIITCKQEKDTSNDSSTLGLKPMGRVIPSQKQRGTIDPTNLRKKNELFSDSIFFSTFVKSKNSCKFSVWPLACQSPNSLSILTPVHTGSLLYLHHHLHYTHSTQIYTNLKICTDAVLPVTESSASSHGMCLPSAITNNSARDGLTSGYWLVQNQTNSFEKL